MPSPPPNPGSFSVKIPAGDNRERRVCDQCGFIDYANPKVVVGSVASWEGRILLCRRAIEPRSGLWTLPAGYLEERETPEQGAQREAWEEARAELEILALLGVYSIPRISQVQLIYKARLRSSDVAAGEESLEVGLFEWKAIPWDRIAFSSVSWALERHREIGDQQAFTPFREVGA